MPGSPFVITSAAGLTILKSLRKRTSITVFNPGTSAGAVTLKNQDVWIETSVNGVTLNRGDYAYYVVGNENPETGLSGKAVTADTTVYIEEGISK